MRRPFHVDIPPHIAEQLRVLDPGLKKAVRSSLDAIAESPESGDLLMGELALYRKYRVRRYRIVYAVDPKKSVVRIVAIGHRRDVYETLADQLKAMVEKFH